MDIQSKLRQTWAFAFEHFLSWLNASQTLLSGRSWI
jgi:hypothetical protein